MGKNKLFIILATLFSVAMLLPISAQALTCSSQTQGTFNCFGNTYICGNSCLTDDQVIAKVALCTGGTTLDCNTCACGMPAVGGDNLGDHLATKILDMAWNGITNIFNITAFFWDSNGDAQVRIDADQKTNPGNHIFKINNGLNTTIFQVDETGTLNTGYIPWARLSAFPAACAAGKYVSAIDNPPICTDLPVGASQNLFQVLTAGSDAKTLVKDVYIGDATHFSNFYVGGGEISSKYFHATDPDGNNSIAGKLGIGTTAPSTKLQINGSGTNYYNQVLLKNLNPTGSSAISFNAGNNTDGFIGINGPSRPDNPGDFFLGNTNADSGGVIFFTGGGGPEFEKMRIDLAGNVGIGTKYAKNLGAKLEVAGQVKITGGNPGVNKVLTTVDGSGLATWETAGGGLGGSGTLNYISKFTPNGTTLGNSQIFDNGTNVGIGTVAPAAGTKLDVAGIVKMTGFQLGATATAGQVLTANTSGVGTWQNPAAAAPESDPQVGTIANNYVPKWNGSELVTSNILDNGTSVGVGMLSPNPYYKLDVNGSVHLSSYPNALLKLDGDLNLASPYLEFAQGGNARAQIQYERNTATLQIRNGGNPGNLGVAVGSTGNVGIGTAAPGYKLDVNGDVNISAGSIYRINGANVVSANPGIDNFFFGASGNLTMTGGQNLGLGWYSLRENTTGIQNTAVGLAALYANTTGRYNTATGKSALYANTTGSYNTANGVNALLVNNNGSYNTANGMRALEANTGGGYNTADGFAALWSNTVGIYNVGLGFQALDTNQTGNKNIAIGAYADVVSSNLTNSTAIGYNAKVATNNSLVLGGTGADAVNVGIGTPSPTDLLDVNSNNIRIRNQKTPAQGSACDAGEISWNVSYVYVCVAANTWRRSALSAY